MLRRLGSAIGVGFVNHTHDGHAVVTIIDPVDVSIRSASGAVSILEWWTEPLPDAMRVVKQRTNDDSYAAKASDSGRCSASCRRAVGETTSW